VLSGVARARAIRHLDACAECHHAVAVQREAVWALRAAPAPSLPSGLLDRLRVVPQTTPVPAPPTVLGPDGSAMFAVTPSAIPGSAGPLAANAVVAPGSDGRGPRMRPVAGAAALLTAFGLIAAGSGGATIAGHSSPGGGDRTSAPVQHVPAAAFIRSPGR
jgi:hypothetical protein